MRKMIIVLLALSLFLSGCSRRLLKSGKNRKQNEESNIEAQAEVQTESQTESHEKEEEELNTEMETAAETAAVEETESEETESEETQASEVAEASGVTPELKEYLDSYEAFVDEYVAFMRKYYKNPSDLSLLTNYAGMLQKMSDFDDKLEKYDTDEMSKEDYNYYMEVTLRCSQKMLNVLAESK